MNEKNATHATQRVVRIRERGGKPHEEAKTFDVALRITAAALWTMQAGWVPRDVMDGNDFRARESRDDD